MTSTPSRHPLSLASHVRACEADGHVILLDLKRNRYVGVGAETSKALAVQVNGWPVSPAACDPTNCTAAIQIQRLMSQGLLTESPRDRRPDSTIETATESLDLDDIGLDRRIGANTVVSFAVSAATAASWLKFRSMHSIARTIANRRQRLMDLHSESMQAMHKRAVVYDRLRPLFFTARDRCLHDSLALSCFLASDGLFPHWVVGVKTSPFGAHSWLQCGTTVLNDQHENVRRFQPILVV